MSGKCFLDVDMNLAQNPCIICSICIEGLQTHFSFISSCLDIEDKLKNDCIMKGRKLNKINLHTVFASCNKIQDKADYDTSNGLGDIIKESDVDGERDIIKQEEISIKDESEDNESEIIQTTIPIMKQYHQNTSNLDPEKGAQTVFMEMTNSQHEENQNDKTIPESNNRNLKHKRQRRTPDYCYYCENEVLNFARHIQRKHSLEPEVQRILALSPNSAERRQLLSLLRKQGNFLKNSEFLFKPVRKSSLAAENNYMPCQFCFGMYSRKLLWKHKKKCPKNKNPDVRTSLSICQNLLLPKLNTQSELTVKVFPRMLADKVSLTAKKDFLIRAFGSRFLKKHREQRHVNLCSRKMRELAKVLIESHKTNSKIKNLFHLLHPQYFDVLVNSVKVIAKYDAKKDIYFAPSFPMNINRSLKECCDIALLYIEKRKDDVSDMKAVEAEANVNSFRQLLEENWRYKISTQAENNLNPKSEVDNNSHEVQTPVENNICNTTVMKNDKNRTSENMKKVKNLKPRNLVPWNSGQKKVVIEFFKHHIDLKKPPKKDECCRLIKNHPDLLKNKSWQKIKVFVQNNYTKKLKYSNCD